jgi:ribonuclease J
MTQQLRIIPLGGLGEIGKNMTVVEYGRDMMLIDCGAMFPEADMYGIDLVLPQFGYVVQNQDRLRGIVLTHGHQDHIGGLPYLLREIAANVYGTALTVGMAKNQVRDATVLASTQWHVVDDRAVFQLGALRVSLFPVAHSIPGSVGLVIDTPAGAVVHTGDYKLDETPAGGRTTDIQRLRRLTSRGTLALLADSTNADRPGRTPTEKVVADELDRLFGEARHGRIIVATFASMLARLQEIFRLAAKHGRRVALTGRSLEENVALAQKLGYLNVPAGLLVSADAGVPDQQLVILSTGSQGEPRSALNRMAEGKHREIQVKPNDTIIVSGSTIPGNEVEVGRMLNKLFERGANVIYGKLANVHVSGHASRDEMLVMLKTVRPKYLLPVHGEGRHLHLHARLAEGQGMAPERVFVLKNGAVWASDGARAWLEEPVLAQDVLVDGRLVGEVETAVMRDRQRLSQDGVIVAMIPVNARDRLAGEPELISRGVASDLYTHPLLQAACAEVKKQYRRDRSVAQESVRATLQDFFYRETRSRPVVLPSLIHVAANAN